jgi:hypothetical protein
MKQTSIYYSKGLKPLVKPLVYSLTCLLVYLFSACNNYDWDTDHNTTLTPLVFISENLSANIEINYRDSIYNSGDTYTLRWEKVKTGDYSVVFYEVLFYAADESQPVYISKTENNQTENSLTLTDKELNIIAEKAAIPQNATGEIKWKVRASNGVNEALSAESRSISITRPQGYAYYPAEIFVLGSAVETGEEEHLTSPMKKQPEGEYDAYIYLSEGEFYLKEKDVTRRFYITEENELQELFGEDTRTNTPVAPGKIHHLQLNFKNAAAQLTAIDAVELWYSGIDDTWGELTLENPKIPLWSLTKKIELVNYPAALPDYRYKFRLKETGKQGNTSFRFLGYSAQSAANISASTRPEYFQLYQVDDSRSNYCYKFSRDDHDGKNLLFTVDMQINTEFYRHYITIVE